MSVDKILLRSNLLKDPFRRDTVAWVMQFSMPFTVVAGGFFLATCGGWLSDNTSYVWKHWSGTDYLVFLLGPCVGFTVVGFMMVNSLIGEPFVLERWLTAISFLFVPAILFHKLPFRQREGSGGCADTG